MNARRLDVADLAYAAALIDSFGRLTVRDIRGTQLPEVIIQGRRIAALGWLADLTGVKVIEVAKDYNRHQCAEHCPERHTHIESSTGRWVVTGARATIVLHNVERFMRVQGREARDLVEAGRAVGYKTGVANDMAALGWELPELKEQPRARVALAVAR